MANLSVTNTFTDGAVIEASEHNTNNSDITTYINNRNSGSTAWDAVKSEHATNVPVIANNSTGTQNIANFQDNGTNVLAIADGGATTVTATAGGSSVPLTVNNNTSTGNILQLQDNGSNVFVMADGGIWTTGSQSAIRAYRNTSSQSMTQNVVEKVEFNAETFDVKGEWDSTTNYNFTATAAGKYLVTASVFAESIANGEAPSLYIYKDNSVHTERNFRATATSMSLFITDIVSLGAGGVIDIRYVNASGASTLRNDQTLSFVSIHKIA